MKTHISFFFLISFFCAQCLAQSGGIDRKALVRRHNPVVTSMDTLAALSVGNGKFAMTVDATGLQTFPEYYSKGVPLGTQSHWGWHSFPNRENYSFGETLKGFDFGHGHEEIYSVQPSQGSGNFRRLQGAADYFRANPHRLHLGIVGLEILKQDGTHASPRDISGIRQELDLWTGEISGSFLYNNKKVETRLFCHPDRDMISAKVVSPLLADKQVGVKIRFPYPTGAHSDDACDWMKPDQHRTDVILRKPGRIVIKRSLDSCEYYISLSWEGRARVKEKSPHYIVLEADGKEISFSVAFSSVNSFSETESFVHTSEAGREKMIRFWQSGAAVDFSSCTDERAPELERRVILSQYLTAIQCASPEPPQETGLTYNSWFGKFHLEMHFWHQAHFILWNRSDLFLPSISWYEKVEPVAREIARRQHYEGIRWMKMTDPSGAEAPSSVGSFLVWQQPHYIYFSELLYRSRPTQETISKYLPLVEESARFISSCMVEDSVNNRYVMKGYIPAQETLRPEEVLNSPFELSYFRFAMVIARKWMERAGREVDPKWDDIIARISPIASKDGLYLAAESAPQTYREKRFISDHPIVLGSIGILPHSPLVDTGIMRNTLEWIWDKWNWDHTWGWDFPLVAMCAARIGDPEKAVAALLMDKTTNTYLVNGHNYQNSQLRIYLPGNGGLLLAIAMMCAGWDGNTSPLPGFPRDGKWNVRWEGLSPLP
jgi:hypothetical protein